MGQKPSGDSGGATRLNTTCLTQASSNMSNNLAHHDDRLALKGPLCR